MEDVPAGLVLMEVVVRERGGVLEAAPEGLEPARLEVVGEVENPERLSEVLRSHPAAG